MSSDRCETAGQLPVPQGNVADRLSAVARIVPGAIAVAEPDGPPNPSGPRRYRVTTFSTLDETSSRIARGLLRWGIQPGARIALLVPFGTDFIALVFAALKAGLLPVLIDPGMGRTHLLRCLSESEPQGFIAVPRVQAIRAVLRKRFAGARWNVTVGTRWLWGGQTLRQIEQLGTEHSDTPLPSVTAETDAAVIFTTGSTGPPKGVLYTHGTFHAQIDRIRQRYDIHPGSRDLACFPLFGLFDAVMGVTTIVPDMDPTRPAAVNPRRLAEAAAQWEVDQAFGSPALWSAVVRWSQMKGFPQPFPTLRRVLSAGAPVPAITLQSLRRMIHPEATISTPYGATEALPIASIESREVITETGPAAAKGKGICVGTRFPDVVWKVIVIDDGPIETLDEVQELPAGKIGELIVSGPMVTTQYVVRRDQNRFHKIRDGERVWHRMGDVGYLDRQERFWFCGRKAHRVCMGKRTLYSVPCESVFNTHPAIRRTALVARGERPNQTPVIVVEPHREYVPRDHEEQARLIDELRDLASRNPLTRRIDEFVIRTKPLPVDIRHNSKIFREQLAREIGRRK